MERNMIGLLVLIAVIVVGVPLWMALVAWRFAPKGKRRMRE
jgi:hypothetical protein